MVKHLSQRYQKSESLLERALKTIPLGTQTFSKSITQFPRGASPFFVNRALGGKIWDVDGNEYVDFSSALAAVTLGYNDPEVNEAVHCQLDKGVTFSLAHPLELEVAELIVDMVPCAEMVRFGKNGSDATAGAVRIARAYTGREHIAVCGYHGWQDWYIASTSRNRGVPHSTRELVHPFIYNEIESLKKIFSEYNGQVAAVILEPMNVDFPSPGFLEEVKRYTHSQGTVLIFDEMITGFRFARGGAQELFGVTPDLACFGKGLANGFPLSALVGKSELMSLMSEVFFSFTFGGETLSLAAAKVTLMKLKEEPVIEALYKKGGRILSGVDHLIQKHDAKSIFSISGNQCWTFSRINDSPPYSQWDIQTLRLQEFFKRGVLMTVSHNVTYAHTDDDIEQLLSVYDEVLPLIVDAVKNRNLASRLACEPLKPLFRVR